MKYTFPAISTVFCVTNAMSAKTAIDFLAAACDTICAVCWGGCAIIGIINLVCMCMSTRREVQPQ